MRTMTPLKPISSTRKAFYGVAFFVLFVAAWAVATFGGFVSPTFLADPLTMLREGYLLFAKYGFAKDVALTIWRVLGGFVLVVAVTVGGTRRDLVEAAYTLGADARGIVRRVLLPNSAPAIAETLRLVLGWAWTYVIVAELIGASSGIGHMITDSQALLNTGQIIFGIIVIG